MASNGCCSWMLARHCYIGRHIPAHTKPSICPLRIALYLALLVVILSWQWLDQMLPAPLFYVSKPVWTLSVCLSACSLSACLAVSPVHSCLASSFKLCFHPVVVPDVQANHPAWWRFPPTFIRLYSRSPSPRCPLGAPRCQWAPLSCPTIRFSQTCLSPPLQCRLKCWRMLQVLLCKQHSN